MPPRMGTCSKRGGKLEAGRGFSLQLHAVSQVVPRGVHTRGARQTSTHSNGLAAWGAWRCLGWTNVFVLLARPSCRGMFVAPCLGARPRPRRRRQWQRCLLLPRHLTADGLAWLLVSRCLPRRCCSGSAGCLPPLPHCLVIQWQQRRRLPGPIARWRGTILCALTWKRAAVWWAAAVAGEKSAAVVVLVAALTAAAACPRRSTSCCAYVSMTTTPLHAPHRAGRYSAACRARRPRRRRSCGTCLTRTCRAAARASASSTPRRTATTWRRGSSRR